MIIMQYSKNVLFDPISTIKQYLFVKKKKFQNNRSSDNDKGTNLYQYFSTYYKLIRIVKKTIL